MTMNDGTTTDHQELKRKLKELLVSGLRLQDLAPDGIADDQPIFVEGLGLDSIDALELVVLIEEHFGIAIPDEELGKKAFASINALADFIETEQARGG
jgi:acyl carrier protein